MKWQDRAAVAGGAFREERQHIALLQGLGHLVDHPQSIAARGTADVQSTAAAGQRAQHRPVAYVVFGDKAAMYRGVQDGNIQPGNMVAHQHQRALAEQLAFDAQLQTQNVEHGLRPLLHRLITPRLRPSGETQTNRQPATQHMQQQTQKTPGTAQLGGLEHRAGP